MAGKQAKILSDDHVEDLVFFAENSRYPDRNRLIVLLSVKAGLRAAEIAILAAGEAGYSRLMGRDVLESLEAVRHELSIRAFAERM